MSLFVALQIPPAVRKNLAEFLAELRALSSQPSWVRAENLHVTLKYIGEVQPETLNAIRAALSAVHSDRLVTLDFRGVGFFPNEKKPQVFWVGVEASTNLKQLARDIEQDLLKLRIWPASRPFSPHLTLARFKPSLRQVKSPLLTPLTLPRFEPAGLPENLLSAIQENTKREFGSVAAGEFHLIESKLKPCGAEYTTLETFPFVVAEV